MFAGKLPSLLRKNRVEFQLVVIWDPLRDGTGSGSNSAGRARVDRLGKQSRRLVAPMFVRFVGDDVHSSRANKLNDETKRAMRVARILFALFVRSVSIFFSRCA